MFWGAPVPPFFAGNGRPEGLPRTASRGREIQQTLPGGAPGTPPYFVSLFDPDENTPFYSAYKVTPAQAANLGTFGRGDINTKNWRNPPGMLIKNPGLLTFLRTFRYNYTTADHDKLLPIKS